MSRSGEPGCGFSASDERGGGTGPLGRFAARGAGRRKHANEGAGRSILPMPTTEQIMGSIEQRIRDLRAEIDALAAARAELIGSRSESPKRPTHTTRSGGSGDAGAAQAGSTVLLRDAEQAVAKPKVIQRAPRKTAPPKPNPGETKRKRVSVAEAIAKAERDYPAGTPLFSPEEQQAMAKPKPTQRASRTTAPAKPKPRKPAQTEKRALTARGVDTSTMKRQRPSVESAIAKAKREHPRKMARTGKRKAYARPTQRALEAQGLSPERSPRGERKKRVNPLSYKGSKPPRWKGITTIDNDVIMMVRCPVCGAKVGEKCHRPSGKVMPHVHGRRANRIVARGRRREVRMPRARIISGGGFETNRRRH